MVPTALLIWPVPPSTALSTTSIRLLALCSPTCTARTTQPKKLEAKWSALFVLCRRGSMIDQLCTPDGESTTEGIRKIKNSF